MDLKQFEEALKKGLGRVIYALQEDANKYREVVEKYIDKCLSYDYIIEGTRSRYMYKVLSFYNDKKYFYNKLSNKFKNMKFDNIKDFHYLSEMLVSFYNDGFEEANTILWDKYYELYKYIYNKKKLTNGLKNIIEMLVIISLELSFEIDSFKLIVNDLGNLLLNNNLVTINDFSWLCDVRENYLHKIVQYEDDYQGIKYFTEKYLIQKEDEIKQVGKEKLSEIDIENKSKLFSIRLSKENLEIQKDYAYKYLEAKDDKTKIKYLKCFEYCTFPLLPEFLFEETKSKNKELRLISYRVLKNMKNESVKLFALSKIKTNLKYVFPILLNNYNKETDKELVRNCILNLKVTASDNTWHYNYMEFLGLFNEYEYENLPYDVLGVMYENSLCSYCRGDIFDKMIYNDLLTDDILYECKEDCNTETADIANDLFNYKNI